MKISKTAVLALGGLFMTAGLGLMFVSADDAVKQLKVDMSNAVQHFYKVRFISSSNNNSVVDMTREGGQDPLFKIGANNFVITQTGATEKNSIAGTSNAILGGIRNTIGGSRDSVILGGSGNKTYSQGDTILGGVNNSISNGSFSSILGGSGNKISNIHGVIVGGSDNEVAAIYGVAVGKNVHVKTGSSSVGNSVALGSNATVQADGSFLWSDGTPVTLGVDNLFAVNGASGMVVNANAAHSFARLTIGGSLIIKDKNQNLSCTPAYRGVLKIKKDSGKTCFCSCDGSGRNSVIGGGFCMGVCDDSKSTAMCNDVDPIISCPGNVYNIENGCQRGTIVQGTGSYLIDERNYIHWTCMEENGNSKGCSGFVQSDPCTTSVPTVSCDYDDPAPYKCKLSAGTFAEGVQVVFDTGYYNHNYTWKCIYGGRTESCQRGDGSCPSTQVSSGGCHYTIPEALNNSTQKVERDYPLTKVGSVKARCENGTFKYSDWVCRNQRSSCPETVESYNVCNFRVPATAHNATVTGIFLSPNTHTGKLVLQCFNGHYTVIEGSCSIPTASCKNRLNVNPNQGKVTLGGQQINSATGVTRDCGSTITLSTDPGKSPETTTSSCYLTLSGNAASDTTLSITVKKINLTGTTTKTYAFSGWTDFGDCGTWTPSTYVFPGGGYNGKECTKIADWRVGGTTLTTGSITLPGVTRDNCTFSGWYTTPSGGTGTFIGWAGSSYSGACTTLYARWICANNPPIPPTPDAICKDFDEYLRCLDGTTGTALPLLDGEGFKFWKCGTTTCKTCDKDNGYKINGDVCTKCNNCAKNGFPYCFPIDFNPTCKESDYPKID